MKTAQQRPSVIATLAAFCVRLYQLVFSPIKHLFFGPACGCRFQPTCSCYARSALLEHGFFCGLYLSIRRILRCHPWHPGGYDPVPDLKSDSRQDISAASKQI